ncbi:MAG: hypothetical protein JXA33_27590, partial [Anaerolineae bacterium]|nr:hypothetical protein [Anaerolineae bacterium]
MEEGWRVRLGDGDNLAVQVEQIIELCALDGEAVILDAARQRPPGESNPRAVHVEEFQHLKFGDLVVLRHEIRQAGCVQFPRMHLHKMRRLGP